MSELADDPILADLTAEQREAVTHAEGPLMVVAGPGSGKTRVITRRVAYLVDRCGVPGRSVLAITFTNKAADEMRARIDQLIGREAGVVVSTFHSFCARLLRRYGPNDRTRDFAIYDEDDQRACVRKIVEELKLDEKQWRPGSVLARISDAKNRRESADQFDALAIGFHDRTVARVYRRYEDMLREFNALDFDDLLLYALDVLETRDDVREALRERYRYVLVDEYQDTNRPQYDIANQLAGKDGNLCVVGDPDQSVYKWRGADIRNILDFESDHPSTRVIKLERNYRSTKRILAAAQAVIEHNTERRDKTLFTENEEGERVRLVRCLTDDEEARLVAREVDKRIRSGEVTPGEIAIFYRTNALSRKFEESLRNLGIKHVVVGAVPFFARKEVKDALALLRLLANPRDEQSVRRAIAAYAEGFGAKTLERVAEFARENGATILDALRAADAIPGIQQRQRHAVQCFAAIIEGLAALPPSPVGPLVREVVERTGELRRLKTSKEPQDWSRAENLEALVNGGFEFDQRAAAPGAALGDGRVAGTDYRAFLDQAALLASTDQDDGDGSETVKLMSLHAAKGLEFDEVFIAGVDGKILPLERDLEDSDREEERRLFYVGLTRARKRVTLTTARVRRTYGQEKPSAPSPFLKEIPEDLLEQIGGGSYAEREAFRPASLGGMPRWGRRGAGPDEDGFDAADTKFSDEDDFLARSRLKRPSPPDQPRPQPPHQPPLQPKTPQQQTTLAWLAAEPPRAATATAGEIGQGDRVEHDHFGAGQVLEIQGSGVNRRVRVLFENFGVKLLVMHYANLRKPGSPSGSAGRGGDVS